ncbi:LabA-like NYN domain-containing protein [Flocculibacter collagenilyticus]|uniref:LabA-like NYN domain-containing protein n=1 Tax=Flocculibacter collagenilyticus TaxID=2744479 RepID=UPI0018F7C4C6|nr:NYN domain-containing protein [Flocculibacter collagenilyticus]
MQTAAIFVDVQNIYYTVKQQYGCHFNYRKFWQNISEQYNIETANAYAIDRGDKKQMGFQQILKDIGFNVKLKPMISRADGSAKGDWDVGITIDIMEAARDVDNVILLSGDGDFTLLLDHIRQRYGVNTHVFGVTQLTADTIINSDAEFHPINEPLLLK